MDWLSQQVQEIEKDAQRTSDDINVQGSSAWLKWRGKGLGSSDAAVLLGWSPWKNIKQLFEEKIGIWTPTFGAFQMKAMERGKELEPVIRRWYETQVRNDKFPDHIAEAKHSSILRASFDGWNPKFKNPEDGSVGRIIEIKAPNAKDHELARNGELPLKYQAQVQWLMMVGKIQWCDYVSYGADGTYCVVAVMADATIQEELLNRAGVFWTCVENKAEPSEHYFSEWRYPLKPLVLDGNGLPEKISQDFPAIVEQETEKLVQEAILLQAQIEKLETKFDIIKDKLKIILGDKDKLQCGEAVFGWQIRKGTVKYADIPELALINLEQYRGKEVKAFYFKRNSK